MVKQQFNTWRTKAKPGDIVELTPLRDIKVGETIEVHFADTGGRKGQAGVIRVPKDSIKITKQGIDKT